MATSPRGRPYRNRRPFWENRRSSFSSEPDLYGHHETKIHGVVVFLKEDQTFGFIKPLEALPQDYSAETVYFKPAGIRYEKGDDVKFVLRGGGEKHKPSARNVWLMRRAHSSINQLLTGQEGRTIGSIVELAGGKGHIQIVGDIPPEHKGKSDKVYFDESWVSCGHLELMQGDMVEFNIAQNKKHEDELSAYRIKLVECRQRSAEDIHEYIRQVLRKLSENEVITDVLSSITVWQLIGQCDDFTTDGVIEILDFINVLDEKSEGWREHFKEALTVLISAGFCNIQGGNLKRLIQEEWQDMPERRQKKIQHFLLTVLKYIPKRARLAVKLIEFMLPKGERSMEHFVYDALKLSVQDSAGDLQDFDWNELPLVPTPTELCSNDKAKLLLKGVKERGPYECTEEYADTYFRLLREDCFSALKSGIDSYLQNTLDHRDMYVYKEVTLAGINISGTGLAFALKVKPIYPVQNWETCSNLMSGNLLCLSPSGSFNDIIWATVAERNSKLLKTKQTVWVELSTETNAIETTNTIARIINASGRIVIAESPTYYKAYHPVLKTLQQIKPTELPFQQELVHMDPPQQSPYAQSVAKAEESKSRELSADPGLDDDKIVDDKMLMFRLRLQRYTQRYLGKQTSVKPAQTDDFLADSTMDNSQKAAFKQALENRVAVIQGPPGTGKTYIGIQIVKKLLESEETKLPIAVFTYKNHALDEFLKGIVQEVGLNRIVRVGGRSQEPVLQGCNLTELKKEERHHSSHRGHLKEEANMLGVQQAIQNLLRSRTLCLQTVLNCFNEQQITKLLQKCNANVFDEHSGMVVYCSARDMLSYWHNSKQNLLDKTIDFPTKYMHTPRLLIKFMEAAIQQWAPSKEDFTKMMQKHNDAPSFQSIPSIRNKNKKKKTSNDEELGMDEKDVEEEEKERAATGGKTRKDIEMTVDVEQFMQRTQKVLVMTSSAQQLASETPFSTVQHIPDLWSLKPYDRAVVIQVALWNNSQEAEKTLENLLQSHKKITNEIDEIDNERKLAVLKRAKVVGMTITGASINQLLLRGLKPSIIIIEEAAEVLEAQILAILGCCNVKHLILIGDHKQLRPPVESYNLVRNYHFDVSMMERLINNGYPHATLQLQNRMRPEIAELLKDIYPHLRDNLERVSLNNPPAFTSSSMFFWSHRDQEEDARSYSNKGEAKRVMQLALVFVAMGYKPSQITVLAAYQGQTRLLRYMLRQAEKDHAHLFSQYQAEEDFERNPVEGLMKRTNTISIHTIDLFQGDENDIIIVSLVRSNESGQIGFMKTLNRRCVVQSRAKCGMYFVGNEETYLKARGSCWIPLIHSLQDKQLVQLQFSLHCPLHRFITEIRATVGDDLPLKVICKERCIIEMKCEIHPCPNVCCPKHSHTKCDVVIDFVLPCNHPAKRKCYQAETAIICQSPCSEFMECLKHPCPKLCKPYHSHQQELCTVPVDFVFIKCQHPATKKCGRSVEDVRCLSMVKFQLDQCKHWGARQCWQSEDDIKCKEKCTKQMSCGHPCEGRCKDPCDPFKCRTCEEKRKHEEKEQRKAEEQAREDARNAATAELTEYIENRKHMGYSKVELFCEGNDVSEYYDIEDRVKKYIQPGHGWFPEVTTIEKITNPKLHRKLIETKTKMVNPLRSELKFHGTDKGAVDKIIQDGFKIPRNYNEKTKMYGNGIYFATDASKSAQTKYTKGSNMLLLCEVLIGQAFTVQHADPKMTQATLKRENCDSLFAPRNTAGKGGVRYDEYVIFNPYQALPRYVIHYKTYNVNNVLSLPMQTGTSQEKHILLPKREFNASDALDMHFRLAESQFLRLTERVGSIDKVKSVEYYTGSALIEKFEKKKSEFEQKYTDQTHKKTVLAFHGTQEKNIENIMKNNFSMDHCVRGVHGKGIYLSEFPDISKGYDGGSRKLILCNLLPGKGYDKGLSDAPLQSGYDSHKVKEDKEGRAWAHVIYNPDQILPMYVISY